MSPRQTILRFCIVLILVIAMFGSGQRPVLSATNLVFTVNSTEDLTDAAPGNSVCSANQPVDGPCTLRAAITEANANIGTPNQNITIKLPAGEYNLTIPPAIPDNTYTGDLDIAAFADGNANSITIEPLGSGPVVIRNTVEDRILTVGSNAKVIINNITMRDGLVLIDLSPTVGGGAILNSGNLSLNGVTLLNNLVRCRVESSCSTSSVIGGAVQNQNIMTITNSTLDGNSANRGSAIFVTPSGTQTVGYSTLSNNQNNVSATIVNYGNLTIYNSTFADNSSKINNGPGILNIGKLSMQSTTMANTGDLNAIVNSADAGVTAILKDNIFKAELGHSNCYIVGSTWTSGGYNIANDESCNLTAVGDLSSTDPLLGGFGSWGGPTKTYMLSPGSPALNHRPGACQLIVNFLIDDQRHWPRSDGQCDTGSYEFSPWYLYLPAITK